MKSYLPLSFAIVLVVLLSVACAGRIPIALASAGIDNVDHTRLTRCTDVKTRFFACGAEDDEISVTVRPRLLRGQIAWVLLDPAGQIRWSSQAHAPYWFAQTRRFAPMPGAWKLKSAVVEASGEYRITWRTE